ncbi:AI-2E family transporter [Thalassoglobus polymorphus]|uniref:Putative inner membrane protein n=1 Tax=Thalassoglobus polymorphus TaxID=2527994 RepID=A0A517QNS8_9PLAN|nr:AI-2E family transporter [Thalassoglobus polymorphus]QDT33290.1 putative inner membrane protein [Thalassoglobus polymorphus]
MSSMRRKVSLVVLLVLIVALGVTFFRVVAPFLLPLFLAGMTAVVCQPLFRYFLSRTKDQISLSAALTTATIMTSILVPLITGILIATLQLYTFSSRVVDENRWLRIFLAPEVATVETDSGNSFTADVNIKERDTILPERKLQSVIVDDVGNSEPVVRIETTVKPESVTNTEDVTSAELKDKIEGAEQEGTEPDDTPVDQADEKQDSDEQPPATASSEAAQPTVLDDAVNYVNSWLPKELKSNPADVSREIRLRIGAMLHDLGDRSLGRAAGTTFGFLAGAAGAIISALIGLMMYVVALYYFLADGTTLLLAAEKMIPVHAKYQRQLLEQFALVVRSVVVATFLAAFAQGFATTFALWLFDFDHLFILLMLATISALIPIAGTWLVWVPCAIILFATGHWVQAILLTIYGAAFVGFLDNVVRTYVLNSDTKLHPLLAFISILGGLQVMGLWGVFIGPIVASCLHALVQIFNHELQELSKEKDSAVEGLLEEG